MDLSDKLWTEKWQPVPYKKIVEGPVEGGCGCEDEPLSSLWCAALAEAMGERYREGMRVLDYGCGYARFFNFLTGRLNRFAYYGLEVPDSQTGHGQKCIRFAKSSFGADGRARFGFIGSKLEKEALREAEIILLGSIATHLDFEAFESLFGKFRPVIDRGGAIVFSVVLGDAYTCVGLGEYGIKDCYKETRYTRSQLLEYCHRQQLGLTEAERFQSPKDLQTIYRVEGHAGVN